MSYQNLTMREKLYHSGLSRDLFLFALATVGLAVLGPFGTYSELRFPSRLVYWGVLCFGVGLCMVLCIKFVMSQLTQDGRVSIYPAIAAGAAIAAVPGAALVFLMYWLMRENPVELGFFPVLYLWLKVALVGVFVSCVELWRQQAMAYEADYLPPTENAETSPLSFMGTSDDSFPDMPAFFKRMSHVGPETQLISLSMQDHYVEVTSTDGSEMILMRFADALEELDGIAGLRILRSHWVAADQLQSARRAGTRNWALLSDGRELPVSRTYLDDVQAFLDAKARLSDL